MKNTNDTHGEAVRQALSITDQFTAAFNRMDYAGMDATLHFPHIFPGVPTKIWEKPGSLTPEFFRKLQAQGWHHSVFMKKEPILTSADRVHLLVEYTRNRKDGEAVSSHRAIWIVTCIDGRWGIQVRSNE